MDSNSANKQLYDLAVIRVANGDEPGAIEAAKRAIALNPKLVVEAKVDDDLKAVPEKL